MLKLANLFLCLGLVSCGAGNFNGKGTSTSPRLGGNNGPGGDSSSLNGGQNDGPGGGLGSGGTTATTKSCQDKTVKNMNISIIFDRSDSLLSNDPSNIRRAAALTFLQQLSAFSAAHPEIDVKVNSSAFCFSLSVDSDWISLKSASGVNSAIAAIKKSTSNTCLGTYYSDSLKHAAKRFAQINTSVQKKTDRNYVLFFTDGLPLKIREGSNGILEKVANLTNNYGAAMIGIASGSDIPSKGENIVRSMALPSTGIVNPSHTGLYLRAASASDMKSSFLQAFEKVKGC